MGAIRSRATAVEAALAALISTALALVPLAPVLPLLDRAWNPGDMLSQYLTTISWNGLSFTRTDRFGFPLGMDLNYFPNGDILENHFTSAVSAVTGSPFIGVNLLIVVSFPVLAALSLVAIRMTGLGGPIAEALAVAFTLIPYHWARALFHTYLSTMFSIVTAVILVLLIATGRLLPALARGSRRQRIVAALGLASLVVVTAWTGIYYAAFAVVLGVSALVWRYLKGDRWRDIALAGLPLVAVAALVLIGQLPILLARGDGAPLADVADRLPTESVRFAGALIAALTPGPLTPVVPYTEWWQQALRNAPPVESTLEGNFGTWVTTACLLVFIVALARRARRRMPVSPVHPSGITPGLVGWLIGGTVLFFIPWGLNFAVAAMLTPQIRSWNRLLPVLLLLFILGAATILRDSYWLSAGRRTTMLTGVILLATSLEVIVPTTVGYAHTVGKNAAITQQARAYTGRLDAAIPGDCGVLQLPAVEFPEMGRASGAMGDYQHLWTSLTGEGKRWSYGALKNTRAAAWQAQIAALPTIGQLALLQQAGFCAIHVDFSGYHADEAQQVRAALTRQLGPPAVAELDLGWAAWALPEPAAPSDPSTWSEELRRFFHPALVTPLNSRAVERGTDLTSTWWWLLDTESSLAVVASDAEFPLTAVSGAFAAPCADVEATVTVQDGDVAHTSRVVARAGASTPFRFELDEPTANPVTLTVTFDDNTATCLAPGIDGLVLGQLRDVRGEAIDNQEAS